MKLRNLLAALLLALVQIVAAETAWAADGHGVRVPRNAHEKLNREDLAAPLRERGEVRVIVGLQTPQEIAERVDHALDQLKAQAVAARQQRVLQRLAGHNLRNVKRFRWHHFVGLTVDAAGLDSLLADPEVTSVAEDRPNYPLLLDTPVITRADAAWAEGFRGGGQAVAILDSGVASGHPFFTGKVVAEACFSDAAGNSTTYCPNGQSQQIGTGAGINCPDTDVSCWHGTHVAGIAAGRTGVLATNRGGMAPDAQVIAIQVFQRACFGGACGMTAFDSDLMHALEHVYSLRNTYNIASVNMSLGGAPYASNCDGESPAITSAIQSLRAAGIATVISSGNGANAGAITFPACISSAISVGSTDKLNVISSFSNSAGILSLLAPGNAVLSSMPGGGYGNASGTSMAAPHVAGAWAVLKSAKPSATVAEVLASLQNAGVPITDARNGLTKRLIQIGYDATTPGALGLVLGHGNVPPTVSITSPAGGGTFLQPANVTVSATAADSGGGISKVEFFSGQTRIASLSAAPYSFVWTGVPVGTYTLTAVATDVIGGTTTSLPVSILVNAPDPSASAQITGTIRRAGAPFPGVNVSPVGACLPTDSAGAYRCTVWQGWSGSVTPSQGEYGFAPASRSYSNVVSNQTAQDFTALVPANVALPAYGGVASASSTLSAAWPVASVNNNERAGVNLGNGGGWADSTINSFPDWVQITFKGTRTINRVVLYTVQDNWQNPIEPTDTLTFTQWGITDFTVQGWNGSAWVTLATVTGNNLVKRSLSIAAFSTDRIRINVTDALAASSRITEIEAWSFVEPNLLPTTTMLTSSLNPATVGASVTFTATVTGTVPAGGVSFTDGGTALSGCSAVPLSGNGNTRTATCSTGILAVGNHNIVASYAGDPANAASASAALMQVINAVATTTTLSSSLNPATAGASVTLTATVTGSAPTGSVAFTDGGSTISGCSAASLVGSGNTRIATCTKSNLAGGTHSIVASYSGNSTNAASTSSALAQVINGVATITTLSSSLNPATVGASVTFTATVTGSAPTGSVAFTDGGGAISGCGAAPLVGSGNTRTATCSTSSLGVGSHSIVASYGGNSANAPSNSVALSQVVAAATVPVNVALQANGGVASASSYYVNYGPLGTNNGDRKGLNWGAEGGWNDLTADTFPDWLQVTFNGVKTINEIDVFSVQNNAQAPVEPTPTLTFTNFGLTDFRVQYWTGSAWANVPGGVVTGNNLVWRRFTFSPISTDRIRVLVNAALGSYSRIVELEAWSTGGSDTTAPTVPTNLSATGITATGATLSWTASADGVGVTGYKIFRNGTQLPGTVSGTSFTDTGLTPSTTYSYRVSAFDAAGNNSAQSSALPVMTLGGATSINVALQANGGVASASSYYVNYGPLGTNNGDRKGLNWGAEGGWNDLTADTFPDWLQVTFNGVKTINEIDVFSVQNNAQAPVEPTPTLTFTNFGLTDFRVQYWTGSAWANVPGGVVTGNNLVWRRFTFSPISTDRIRVLVNAALGSYSRIVELEAWSTGGSDTTAPTVPTNLSATGITSTGATLSWTASADGVGVTGYKIFRNGTQLPGTVSGTSFTDTGLTPSTTYSYRVSAFDAAGNNSAQSSALPVMTLGGATSINVALQANGGVASASSYYVNYGPLGTNNGDRKGLNWGAEGGWNDLTADTFPDWLQVTFNGVKTINEIDVFSVQNNAQAPVEPTPTLTFTNFGLTDFRVQYWTGSAWANVPGGVVTGNNLVWRRFTFSPISTDRIRVLVNGALGGYSRLTELEAWTSVGGGAPSAGGGDTTAPSVPTGLSGSGITATGVTLSWAASTDNLGVTGYKVFRNGVQLPGAVSGTSFTDSGLTPSTTYSYTVSAFDAAGNDSAQSSTLPVTTSIGNGSINVALQANGGIASASSFYVNYGPIGTNNGDRKGLNWNAEGGWNDLTANSFPDWLQVTFNGMKTINEINVFSVQDTPETPAEPTPTMTFTTFGLTSFQVQYWTGSAWANVPGGVVTGNNLVWRRFTFAHISTDRVRVLVNSALGNYSRLTELEAWTAP